MAEARVATDRGATRRLFGGGGPTGHDAGVPTPAPRSLTVPTPEPVPPAAAPPGAAGTGPGDPDEHTALAARELAGLLDGARRFARGEGTDHYLSPQRRAELLEGQEPRAIVLGCVDARVPPEVVFDQGVGDLFTVRTAGQSLAGVALGSIEFGVRMLGVPLVVVLGHTGCGAVLAGLAADTHDGHLGALAGEVASRLTDVVGDDPVHATGANLQATVDALRALGTLVTPSGREAYVVGLLYDMATGEVTVEDGAGLPMPDRPAA